MLGQMRTRRSLLRSAAALALGSAGAALLTACGGAATATTSAATSGAAPSAASASAGSALPTAIGSSSAGTAETASAVTSTIATVTTSAGATTTAPVASASAPAAGIAALRIGSWLDRPTNKAVYDDQLIGPYQKLHPNVKITVEYTSGTSTHLTKMIAETAAGDPPDIIEVNFDNNQSFADKHVLLALDPFIATSKIDLNSYVKSALELGRYPQGSGKFWAWQTMLAVGVLYYNKTLFQKVGLPFPTDSMDYQTTLLDAAQKLTKPGADESSSFWGFNVDYFTRSFLFSWGFQAVSDDGKKALFDAPESIAAHQFWVDLNNKYKVSTPSDASKVFNVPESPFESGHLGMSIDGSYEIQSFQQYKSMDWDVAVPPKGPAGQFSVIKGAPAHGLSPLSKRQTEAWDFMSWWILNQTPDQVVNPGNLPSRLIALQGWTAAQLKANPVPASIGKLVDIAAKNGKPAQVPPHSGDVWAAYTKVRGDILSGKTAVADGLHVVAQQVDGILAQP
jgi:multiple sugar transport system substrate-binding protein